MCLHVLLICVDFMAVGKMKPKAWEELTVLLSELFCYLDSIVHLLGTKLKVSWNIQVSFDIPVWKKPTIAALQAVFCKIASRE